MTWKKEQEKRVKLLDAIDIAAIMAEAKRQQLEEFLKYFCGLEDDEELEEWIIFMLKVRALRAYWNRIEFMLECEEEIRRIAEAIRNEEALYQMLYDTQNNSLINFLTPILDDVLHDMGFRL